jgi:PAS domain S-box-containing protein
VTPDLAELRRIDPTAGEDVSMLNESFRTFNRVTRDLESAYRVLQSRTEQVDARLREVNARLVAKVSELESVTGRLQAVLNLIPCGVVTTDASGAISSVNRAAERILGRAEAELIGRDPRCVCASDGAPLLLLGRAGAAPSHVEREVLALDGSKRRVVSTLASLPDGGALEVLSDLTEISHLRTQLSRLDTLAALGEMAAAIAHEVRNPLNGIEGFTGLLARALQPGAPPDPAQTARYLDRIRRGVADVNEIVTNLLLWARPDRLARSRFLLDELVAEVVADAPVLSGSQVHAAIAVETASPGACLAADRMKLKIVLTNLLRNALEAVGEAAGEVRIASAVSDAGVRLSVQDSGPGVPEEVRKRLFRPFSTGKASGTGLGLAVARKLVEVHGGELNLVSGPDEGARFEIFLPRVLVVAAEEAS